MTLGGPSRLVAVLTLFALVGAGVSGCVPGDDAPRPAGVAASGFNPIVKPVPTVPVVFFSGDGPWTVQQDVSAWKAQRNSDLLQASADALVSGPTSDEHARGITTTLPLEYHPLTFVGSEGRVDVTVPLDLRETDPRVVQQVACTAAQSTAVPGRRPPAEVLVAFIQPSAPEAEPVQMLCDDTLTTRLVSTDAR